MQAGFAHSQEEYERAANEVFDGLDYFQGLLEQSGGPFLLGKTLTELVRPNALLRALLIQVAAQDIRFYGTLIRKSIAVLSKAVELTLRLRL